MHAARNVSSQSALAVGHCLLRDLHFQTPRTPSLPLRTQRMCEGGPGRMRPRAEPRLCRAPARAFRLPPTVYSYSSDNAASSPSADSRARTYNYIPAGSSLRCLRGQLLTRSAPSRPAFCPAVPVRKKRRRRVCILYVCMYVL